MIILFEKFSYSLNYLKRVLPTDREGRFKGLPSGFVGRNGVLDGVGYLYNDSITNEDKDKIKPSDRIVFVLPKVFLDEAGEKAFGQMIPGGSEDDVDKDFQLNVSEDRYPKDFLADLSMWVCSSISQYRLFNPDDKFVESPKSFNFRSDKLAPTLIDVKNSMKRFYDDNQNLVVFMAKNKHCGNNRIDWRRTITHIQPFMQNGSPIYMDLENKKKVFDLDDRLLLLYFSAMNYIEETFGFKMPKSEFYTPMRVNEFRRLLGHRGLMEMRRIKHKYFADKFLKLYNIMKAFFEWGGIFSANNFGNEYLLTSKYNNVFETMIDELVGDPEFQEQKNNEDGKIIDHLYKEDSLIFTGGSEKIWHIGDSKYYKEKTDFDGSIAKQFTYAKNMMQDFFSPEYVDGEKDHKSDEHSNVRYRDKLTEGYNVTPNFFIRGEIPKYREKYQFGEQYFRTEALAKNDESLIKFARKGNGSDEDAQEMLKNELWNKRNRHFKNRLFDRDTLLLQAYDVNFLYVLKAYTSRHSALRDEFKRKAREIFRKNFLELLDNKFNFYKIIPQGISLTDFVDHRFRQWIGKMYCPECVPDDQKTFIIYAEEKQDDPNNLLNATTSNQRCREIEGDRFICLPLSARGAMGAASDRDLNPDIFVTKASQELYDKIDRKGIVELPRRNVLPDLRMSVPKYLLVIDDADPKVRLFIVISMPDRSDSLVQLHLLEQKSYVEKVFDCDDLVARADEFVDRRMRWNDLPWR